jgi:hypothetical protein
MWWHTVTHGRGSEGGNWRIERVASTLHTTSEHGVSSIIAADAHTSAVSSRLNWRHCRFKWSRTFRRKTKSGFCACVITFQTQSTYSAYQKSALCDIPWLFLSTCFPNRSTQPNNISRLLACGMWRRALCPIATKVSEELAASIYKAGECRWWKQVYLKYWQTSTELPGVRCQKSVILIFTAVRKPNLTEPRSLHESRHVTQAEEIVILYVV